MGPRPSCTKRKAVSEYSHAENDRGDHGNLDEGSPVDAMRYRWRQLNSSVDLSKVQSVDQRKRLECGVGFCHPRTCRRTRSGRLCAKERHRVHLRRPTTPSEARQCRPAKRNRDQQPELRLVDQQSDQATAEQRRPGTVFRRPR